MVANADAGQVLVFDSAGVFLTTIGRPGEGPGDFAWVSGIDALSDSLIVSDNQLQRVTVLDDDRVPVRTLGFSHDLKTSIERVYALNSQLWAVRGFAADYPGEPGTMRRTGVGVGYISPDSATWSAVAEAPGMMIATAVVMGRLSLRPAAFTPDRLPPCWADAGSWVQEM